jgi:hypothetical protein
MEVIMNQMKWELLAEVSGRFEAELMKSYLEAEGIPAQLFQEGTGQDIYPVNFGPLAMVQVFVPKESFDEACRLMEAYKPGTDESETDKDGADIDSKTE